MAITTPFRALHYNPKSISDLSSVITPPYDVISPEQAKMFWAKSPYNFAHLDLPKKADDDYAEAATLLKKWRETGILTEDPYPSYYLYRQCFTVQGKAHTRDTLMCTVELSEFSEGVVRPHENTFGKAKMDRTQLTRKTKCQLSHIFSVVRDPEGFLASLFDRWQYDAPLFRTKTEDGVEHQVWRAEGARFPEVGTFFEDRAIYIVDGHHRYESAVAYAKELGVLGKKDHPASRTLFTIANSYDPALIVLPTHRLIIGSSNPVNADILSQDYVLEPMTYAQLEGFIHEKHPVPQFVIALKGELFQCTPRDLEQSEDTFGKSLNQLAVVWSDRQLLPKYCGITDENRGQKIRYEKDLAVAWSKRNEAEVIIFHSAPSVEDIIQVADERGFMPQKSTYFYPKLASGITLRNIAQG